MNIKFSGMILAAGFGKRMLPLTKNSPKPLIEINGITLLDNSINFLKKLGCNEIIINTHYQYLKIQDAINRRRDKDMISIIYEKELLDTGGGVKNAISYFSSNNILIINSDVYWTDKNLIDAKLIIESYSKDQLAHLLLVEKQNANGLLNNYGDFSLYKNFIKRFIQGDKIIYYAGLQILNSNIFNNFLDKKFSLNVIWNSLIQENKLCGKIMQSKWYHVGDIKSLSIVRKLLS